MKIIITTLFFLLISINLSQSQIINSNTEKNEFLKINKIFSTKIKNLEDQQNTLKDKLENNIDKRLNLSSTVIQNQDSFINRILWIFSILIGLLAIFFTLVSYFALIKPSRDLIEETKKLKDELQTNLKKEISLKLTELLYEQRVIQIEENLNNILSDISYLRTNAFSFFAVNQNLKLTNEQINKVYDFLLSNKANDFKIEKGMLESLFSKQDHKNVEKYFRDSLDRGLDQNDSFMNILKYFQFSGFENYLKLLVKAILFSSSPYKSYVLSLTLLSQDKISCNLLLNERDLNDNISITDLVLIFYTWGQMIKIIDSYLYEKIKANLFTCPCCGYKVFTEEPENAPEQCKICKWKHYSQYNQANFKDISCNNGVSLKEAQENFDKSGVSFKEALNHNLAKKEYYEKDPNFQKVL